MKGSVRKGPGLVFKKDEGSSCGYSRVNQGRSSGVQICRITALIFFLITEKHDNYRKCLILNYALEKIVAIKDSIGIDGKFECGLNIR